jgi:hypothetical protein
MSCILYPIHRVVDCEVVENIFNVWPISPLARRRKGFSAGLSGHLFSHGVVSFVNPQYLGKLVHGTLGLIVRELFLRGGKRIQARVRIGGEWLEGSTAQVVLHRIQV